MEQVSLPTASLLAASCPGPVPTNFRQTAGYDKGGGELRFTYDWDASYGPKSALTGSMGELVTYATNPTPRPPFDLLVTNPTETPPGVIPASNPTGMGDTQKFIGCRTPYSTVTYVGTQYYRYKTDCDANWVNIMGPITITRTIEVIGGVWTYKIVKSTVPATKPC